MTRIGVSAGTYDVLTNAHIRQIEEMAQLVDKLIVAIGENPDKEGKNYFTLDEQLRMLRESTKHIPNVEVTNYSNQYLIDFAEEVGACVIFRGLRDEKDFREERSWQRFNRRKNSGIRTVFGMPSEDLEIVSSSFVKALIGPRGWEKEVAYYVPPIVLEALIAWYEKKHLRTKLYARFKKLWERIGATSDPRIVFSVIEAHYGEKHRVHHTLWHIYHFLAKLDEAKDSIEDFDAEELAAFLHDLVDSHGAADNEAKSAKLGRVLMETADLPRVFIKKVDHRLMATNHKKKRKPRDLDARIMIDADLSILGEEWPIYKRYEDAIRQEYGFHGFIGDEYREGRSAFLKMMLKKKRIFTTDKFRQAYEPRARENMQRALEDLKV